jgi:hypothetical protein
MLTPSTPEPIRFNLHPLTSTFKLFIRFSFSNISKTSLKFSFQPFIFLGGAHCQEQGST